MGSACGCGCRLRHRTRWPCRRALARLYRVGAGGVLPLCPRVTSRALTYYKGDYDTFERTRVERAKHQQSAFEASEARRKHMQSFIDRFRYNANRAALVQSRIKALERMEAVEEVRHCGGGVGAGGLGWGRVGCGGG